MVIEKAMIIQLHFLPFRFWVISAREDSKKSSHRFQSRIQRIRKMIIPRYHLSFPLSHGSGLISYPRTLIL